MAPSVSDTCSYPSEPLSRSSHNLLHGYDPSKLSNEMAIEVKIAFSSGQTRVATQKNVSQTAEVDPRRC